MKDYYIDSSLEKNSYIFFINEIFCNQNVNKIHTTKRTCSAAIFSSFYGGFAKQLVE